MRGIKVVSTGFLILLIANHSVKFTLPPGLAVPVVCLLLGFVVFFYSCRVEVLLEKKVLTWSCMDFEAVLDTGIHISLSLLLPPRVAGSESLQNKAMMHSTETKR